MRHNWSMPGSVVFRAVVVCAAVLVVGLGGQARAAVEGVKLLSEPTSTKAIAVESITMRAAPFPLTSSVKFGNDTRTRIALFAMNVGLFQGEGINALSADIEDAAHKLYPLMVEYAAPVPSQPWLWMIVVRLNDDLGDVGDVLMRVNIHGVASNRVRISIGHIGSGLQDDSNAIPTPAPAVAPAATPQPTPDPYAPNTISYADAKRFLEQATWGPTEAEIARVRALGFRAWLDEQFAKPAQNYPTPNSNANSLELSINMSNDSSIGCSASVLTDNNQRNICLRSNYTAYPLQKFFLQRALYGDDQLRQRAAWAMHKINVVSQRDIPTTHWILYYLKGLDNNCFGSYRQLLYDLTVNTAMGEYLDTRNNLNTAASPANENYAREILQLFSVGLVKLNPDGTPQLGSDGLPLATYDQNTVTNFAKVFTGFQFAPSRFLGVPNYVDPMAFTESRHDKSQKILLDGFTLPANQTITQDLNSALDNISNHPSIAPYLSKELIHIFVTSNPSPTYVSRVVAAFNNNCNGLYPSNPCNGARGDMRAVYRAILLDPEARGDIKNAPTYGRLREPVELFTNVARAFNATAFNGSGQSDGVITPLLGAESRGGLDSPTFVNNPNNTTTFGLVDMNMDQDVYRPVTVFSYYPSDFAAPGAPNGLLAPEFGLLGSAAALKRANFLNMLIYNGIANSTNVTNSTPNGTKLSFTAYTGLAANSSQLVDALNQALMHNTLPAAVKTSIVTAVNAIPTTDANYQLKRVQTAVYLIVSSSVYQVER